MVWSGFGMLNSFLKYAVIYSQIPGQFQLNIHQKVTSTKIVNLFICFCLLFEWIKNNLPSKKWISIQIGSHKMIYAEKCVLCKQGHLYIIFLFSFVRSIVSEFRLKTILFWSALLRRKVIQLQRCSTHKIIYRIIFNNNKHKLLQLSFCRLFVKQTNNVFWIESAAFEWLRTF